MGVSTMLITVPEHALVVAVLCNGRGPAELPQPATAVAENVLCALLPGYTAHWDPWPTLPKPLHYDRVIQRVLKTLQGAWQGSLVIHDGGEPSQPLHRTFRIIIERTEDGEDVHVVAQLDDNGQQCRVRLDLPRMAEAAEATPPKAMATMLCGYFQGQMGTVEADRRPHEMHLTLRLREDTTGGGKQRLDGGMSAQLDQQSGFRAAPRYPHPRASSATTHWCELWRVCTE